MNVNTRVGDIKKKFEVLHEINANKTQFRKLPVETSKFVVGSSQTGSSSFMNVHNDLSSRSTKSGSVFNVPVSNRSNIKRTPAFRCDKVAKPSRPPGQINNNNILNKDVGKLCSDRMKQFEGNNSAGFGISNHNLRKTSPQASKPLQSVNSQRQCALTDYAPQQVHNNKYNLQRNKSLGEIQLNNYGSISDSSVHRKLSKTESKSTIGLPKPNISNTKESSRLISNTGLYSAAPKVSNNVFSQADRLNLKCASKSSVPLLPSDPSKLNYNLSGANSSDKIGHIALNPSIDPKPVTNNYSQNFIQKQNVPAVPKTNSCNEPLDPSSLPSSVHAALRAPLPKGPPPKKPPRTFAHNLAQSQFIPSKIPPVLPNQSEHSKFVPPLNQNLASSQTYDKFANLRPVRSKTESQIMLKKLENFLHSQHDMTSLKPKRSREEADLDVGRKSLHTLRKGPLPEVPSISQASVKPTSNTLNHNLCLQSLNCASCTMSPYSTNIYEKVPSSQSQFFIDFKSNPMMELSQLRTQPKPHTKRSALDDPVYAEVASPKDWKLSSSGQSNAEFGRSLSHSSSSPCIAPLTISSSQSGLHYMSTPVESVSYPLGNVLAQTKHFQPNFIDNHVPLLKPRKISSVDEIYGHSKMMALPDSLSKPAGDKIHFSSSSNERNIQMLVNEAYSVPCWRKMSEVSSDSDSTASVSEDFKENFRDGEKEQLTRERKGYVRRVATRALSQKRPTQFSSANFSHLFECLLLIGLDLDPARCKVPYIKSKYPPEVTLPEKFEYLCFPDAGDWPPPTPPDFINQCYTVVITTESAQRKYGYCKRVQPEGAPICLPLAYCIVTPYKADSFYYQLLGELESRHGQTDQNVMNFIKELYENAFPSPGQGVKVTPTTPSTIDQKFDKVEILKRPKDSRQDTDLSGMLSYVRLDIFVKLFSTLLHERKVILLSKFVSVLSMCIEGLQASLYPFQWPHTLATVLSPSMLGFLEAPTPYLFGLLKPYHSSDNYLPSLSNTDEVVVVDLDLGKVIISIGDELSILPTKVAKGLKAALQLNLPADSTTRNLLISEALVRLFVELIGHYREFMFVNVDTQKKEFQREAFINCVESKSVRLFLDWFTETAMFQLFIESRLESGPESRGIFEQRCAEFAEEKDRSKSKNYKGLNKTVKNLGDRLKDWATLS
ncbi:unnamed protein product [Bemisia tabaci]|uniref:UDENN domain-containing protein n=1 Tax=Bemisia tabaci TaxID=7038 RepID=A0A9P0A4K9_BEMTA|nr:unnamed protein product [Bemisia tabaci]